MSTKKEKCCDGECNHDDCCGKVEANCTHKSSESIEWDWEKEFDKFWIYFVQFYPEKEKGLFGSIKRLIQKAITTAVAKKDAQWMDAVEEIRKREKYSGSAWILDDVLSLLKH